MRPVARRIVVALALLAVLLFETFPGGSGLAQTPGDATVPAPGRAALRAEVIRFSVEMELLQIEHDVDRAALLDLMRQYRTLGPDDEGIKSEKELADLRKAVELAEKKRDPRTDPVAMELRRLNNSLVAAEKRRDVSLRIERRRKEFAAGSARLVGLRLDVADGDRRYREAP